MWIINIRLRYSVVSQISRHILGFTYFFRLFKNVQMQGPRWFDKLTMTSRRACPELAEGKDEGNAADGRF
jgi:hypothetical protein